MSRLTFISNADAHHSGGITTAAAGVTGIWNLGTNTWQDPATALAASDTVQLVQGKGSGVYPLFSGMFSCKDLKIVYTPWAAPVIGVDALAVTANGAGTVHSFKIVRRGSVGEYSDMINGSTNFSFPDQVTPIEYVEVTGDTAATIANALSKQVNLLGEKYGFRGDATTTSGTVDVYGATWDANLKIVGVSDYLALTAGAPTLGSGNYWQVLSAEKTTQAMHGYHGRAGSFLNTPDTYTSTTLAANAAIVKEAAPTAPTTGYDMVTLYFKNDGDKAIARENEFSEISVYFDDTAGNHADFKAMFGITTSGTAQVIQL